MQRSIGWLVILGAAALVAGGCNDSGGTTPEDVVSNPGGLFYEPSAYCFRPLSGGDSLHVYNLGDTTLVWTVLSSPDNVIGLDTNLNLEAGTGRVLTWTWTRPGVGQDSLVVESNDPQRGRVVIPMRWLGPDGVDATPPHPVLLGSPDDGAVFEVGSIIPLWWSRSVDCTGPVTYQLQVSTEPGFQSPVCCDNQLSKNFADLITEPGDQGQVWWRIMATDAGGIRSTSHTRTWIVE